VIPKGLSDRFESVISPTMESNYTAELPPPFIARPEELRKLVDLLSDRIGAVVIKATCADDVSREFSSVKELLAYENVKEREIRGVAFKAASDDYKKNARVDLSAAKWRGISLDFQGRDDVVTRLRSDILDIVAGMRPWYAVFHRIDFFLAACLLLFTIGIAVTSAVAMKWVPVGASTAPSTRGTSREEAVFYVLLVLFLAAAFALNRFRDKLFPRGVFLIGQAKGRFKHLEQVQWTVVISFIVSVIAGLVVLVIDRVYR
jgi:hypothetical protein